jgi:K+-sensing histidine kinase KdpD
MKTLRKHPVLLKRIGLIALSSAAILGATRILLGLQAISSPPTAAFSFLIIVLLSAFFGDIVVAIITSAVATLCFDFSFLPPYGTFNIAAFSDWIALAAFLLTSIIISHLTASAADNAAKAKAAAQDLSALNELGAWLLSIPDDRLTLSKIADETLRFFDLEYCSIHDYGDGEWHHITGAATHNLSQEIESRLKELQDHPTDLMELADEDILGVQYRQINADGKLLALLVVKGKALPTKTLDIAAHLVGMRIKGI